MGIYDAIRILQHAGELQKVEDGRCGDCAPVHVRLELTETCNFRCRFCWWHIPELRRELRGLRHENRMMPRERALSLVDELADAGTRAISFTGTGDPLMYPHLAEVLQRLVAGGIVFGLTSNFAVPLGDALLALLARASWLRVSLNAGTPMVYECIHQPQGKAPHKAFPRMEDNVRRLTALLAQRGDGPDFNASFVVSKDNREDIFPAARLARELGLASIAFRADTPPRRQATPYAYRPEDLAAMERATAELQTDRFQVHPGLVRQLDGVISGDPELCCYYSNHTTYIDPRGDVYPCCYARCDAKYILGNILEQPFSDFWHSDARQNRYKTLLQDACPPCSYGRCNQALKRLYQKELGVNDILVVRDQPDPFI